MDQLSGEQSTDESNLNEHDRLANKKTKTAESNHNQAALTNGINTLYFTKFIKISFKTYPNVFVLS